MAWTAYQWFAIVLLVSTGSTSIINSKYINRVRSVGRDGVERKFYHPYVMAWYSGVATMSCLVVYKILFCVISRKGDGAEDRHKLTRGNRDFNVFLFLISAFCSRTGSSLSYIALNLTYVSSHQMLRGSVIVFTGILSMVFLKRKIGLRQWSGITFIILGLSLVGFADYLSKGSEESLNIKEVVIGDIMVVVGQILAASAFVLEEQFVKGLDVPALEATGYLGLFGSLVMSLALIPMYFIRADRPLTQRKGDRMEDTIDAFVQIGNSLELCLAIPCNIVLIAFANFATTTLTKELSATTGKVLDNIRTIIVWAFSLAFFGQEFHWLQLVGYCVMVFGIFLYNGIINSSMLSIFRRTAQGEESDANAEATEAK